MLAWKLRSGLGNIVSIFSRKENPEDLFLSVEATEKSGYDDKPRGRPETLNLTFEQLEGLRQVVGEFLRGQGFKAGAYTTTQIADALIAGRYYDENSTALGYKFSYLEMIEKHPRAFELDYSVRQASAEAAYRTGAHKLLTPEEAEVLIHKGIDQALAEDNDNDDAT